MVIDAEQAQAQTLRMHMYLQGRHLSNGFGLGSMLIWVVAEIAE